MEEKQKFGFWSIVLLGINGIIGTGIFLLPNQAAKLIGPASLGVIIFDMLLVVALAFCFAEAGGMFKKNGGPYIYAKEAFGEFVGFEVGFMKWVVGIIGWAAMAVGFVTALGSIWAPAADPTTKNIIVVALIVALGILNLFGVNIAKYINNISTVGKLLPLLLFVVVGIFFIKGSNFTPVFPAGLYQTGSFGAAALLIFYAFAGFETMAVAAEDMQNPQKNVPKALIAVIVICSVFYLLIQTVAVGTLGSALATSKAPIADASGLFIGSGGKVIVIAGTLISMLGINIAASFVYPRLAGALAEDGLLPKFLNKNGRFGTPTWAIILTVLLTIPLALSGSFAKLAIISAVSRFAQYIPTVLAVLVLRKKRPDLERTFKIPLGPVIPVIALLVSFWLVSQAKQDQLLWGLGGFVVALPIYLIMKVVNSKKQKEVSENQAKIS